MLLVGTGVLAGGFWVAPASSPVNLWCGTLMPHELIYTSAPRGLKPGTTGYCEILRGGATIQLKSKDQAPLMKGDIVTIAVGGGAGYGDPAMRPAALRAADRADGAVSAHGAIA